MSRRPQARHASARIRRLRLGATIAIVAAILVACSVGDVDFSNKACPCGSGWLCDTTTNKCVLVLPSGSQPVPEGGSSGTTPTDSGGPIDAGQDCLGAACACGSDSDCKDPRNPHCGPNKVCVACVAQNDCGAATYCNGQNQCVLGCKGNADCAISPADPKCDVNRHQCVACLVGSDCVAPADRCSPAGQCVQDCNPDGGSPTCAGAGKSCCTSLCIDTTKDPLNCGGCGIVCSSKNGTPSCNNSVCSWTCATGFGHCASGNTGCETNLHNDPANCGACGTSCAAQVQNATGISCASALCDYTACTANHDNCDGDRTNGCECSCGTVRQERCCPGNMCNGSLTCNTGPVPPKCL
jgi:hypothetical protein